MTVVMPWWYMSFVHVDRPVGDRCVGGCYVQGVDMRDAISRSWDKGINPGGQIEIVGPLEPELLDTYGVLPDQRNRLLSREELVGPLSGQRQEA